MSERDEIISFLEAKQLQIQEVLKVLPRDHDQENAEREDNEQYKKNLETFRNLNTDIRLLKDSLKKSPKENSAENEIKKQAIQESMISKEIKLNEFKSQLALSDKEESKEMLSNKIEDIEIEINHQKLILSLL